MGSLWKLCLALAAALWLTQSALAATLRVDKTEPIPLGVYGTIQDAVDASAPGDTISIADGRYDELNRYVAPSGDVGFLVVQIEHAPLTLIGDSRDGVRIGPSYYIGPIGDGNSLCVGSPVDDLPLYFERITFENTYYVMSTGTSTTIRDCTISSSHSGLAFFASPTIEIVASRFENMPNGLALFATYSSSARTQLLSVVDTEFFNCGQAISLLGVDQVMVEDCRFTDCNVGVQFDDLTVGTITKSWFQGCGSSVRNFDGSTCRFEQNVSLGNLSQGLYSSWGHYTGSHNYIEGGIGAAIQIRGNGTASFQDNTLLNGGGWTVHIGARKEYFAEPVPRFDFTGNYWGTTDSTQIADWILDGADYGHLIEVDFAPFLIESPVSAATQSLGSLKARFAPE